MKYLFVVAMLCLTTMVQAQKSDSTSVPLDVPVASPKGDQQASDQPVNAVKEQSLTQPKSGDDSGHEACKPGCTKPCCAKPTGDSAACGPNCTKPCCTRKSEQKEGCGPGCTKPCCAKPTGNSSSCEPGCTKPCCADKVAAATCAKPTLKSCVKKGAKCSPKALPGMHGFVFDLGQAGDALGIRAIEDINGNSSLLWKYVSNPTTVYRIGVGIKGLNYNQSTVDSVGQSRVSTDSTFKQVDLYLAPGYEHHFLGNKRLDPYVGGMVEWGLLGKSKSNLNTLNQDTTGTVTQTVSLETTRGASLGINAFVGFNYYLAKHLALGAEYTLGYQHLFGGGDWNKVTIDVPLSGTNVVQREEGSNVVKSGTFSMNSFVGLTLSYYFHPVSKKDCCDRPQ